MALDKWLQVPPITPRKVLWKWDFINSIRQYKIGRIKTNQRFHAFICLVVNAMDRAARKMEQYASTVFHAPVHDALQGAK